MVVGDVGPGVVASQALQHRFCREPQPGKRWRFHTVTEGGEDVDQLVEDNTIQAYAFFMKAAYFLSNSVCN